ncbi:Phosphoglycerate dehydrogenase [Bordetella sputigena]|uniref:D-2-hydroxyacid dehydrogenase n=1 Tax=Bordetella sputigena TaxID=1416810 RepID=UPI0039EE6247
MLRVYVQNQKERGEAYQITPERWRSTVHLPAEKVHATFHDKSNVDLAALGVADVCVGSGFDPALIQRHARKLKLLHVTSAGVEKYLPLDWLPDGAVFTNSRGVHAGKAEQYALMTLLMLSSKFPLLADAQRHHRWAPVLTPMTMGQRVTIVGLGNLGTAVARAAQTLGMDVTAVTRSGKPASHAARVVPTSNLKDAVSDANYVVLTCPLTDATRGLISDEVIKSIPRGGGLINMARGAVLDTTALINALRENHLSGAVLDVFDEEPLPASSPLWNCPNLVITPHVSCDEPLGYIEKTLQSLNENLAQLLEGRRPNINVVSPLHQY